MEWLPTLPYGDSKTETQIIQFGGVRYGKGGRDGEFSDTHNLSSRLYPALCQREGRTKAASPDRGTALFGWSKLCIVDGTKLLYDGEQVGTVSEGEKQFAVVNTKLCIWPDMVYLDLKNLKFKPISPFVKAAPNSVTFTGDTITLGKNTKIKSVEEVVSGVYVIKDFPQNTAIFSKAYDSVSWNESSGEWILEGEKTRILTQIFLYKGPNAPTDYSEVQVGDIFLLKKSDIDGNYALNTMQYEYRAFDNVENVGEYSENMPYYFAIVSSYSYETRGSGDGQVFLTVGTINFDVYDSRQKNEVLSSYFKKGDRISISGCQDRTKNNTEKGKYLIVESLTAYADSSSVSYGLKFSNATFESGEESAEVEITRPAPNLSFICENENRLWGVSDEDNTIYASSLSDPTNFYVYDGLSTDSYAVAVGSDGKWTGCCPLGGNILFWKEDKLHKLLGSVPSEYQLYTYTVQGVQAGSWKSMKVINEVLYYKGEKGVYAYGGSTPILLSESFGTRRFGNASGGSDGQHYYICMQDLDSLEWGTWVYDTLRGIWLQQLDERVIDFTNLDGDMYYLTGDGKSVWKVGGEDETPIEWSASLYPMEDTASNKRGYSKVLLRIELEKGAYMKAEIREDGGRWRQVGLVHGEKKRNANIYMLPGRCDTFQIRLSGKGRCTVKSLTREFDYGSEV